MTSPQPNEAVSKYEVWSKSSCNHLFSQSLHWCIYTEMTKMLQKMDSLKFVNVLLIVNILVYNLDDNYLLHTTMTTLQL